MLGCATETMVAHSGLDIVSTSNDVTDFLISQ